MIEWLFRLSALHLFQISVLFLLIFAITKWIGNRRPHLALLLWGLFFVKCLVPPLVQSPLGLFAWCEPQTVLSDMSAIESTTDTNEDSPAVSLPTTNEESGNSNVVLLTQNREWTFVLLMVWLSGSGVLCLLLANNYRKVRAEIFQSSEDVKFEERRQTAEGKLESLMSKLEARLDLPARSVRVFATNSGIGPLVFGVRNPTIVVPVELVDENTNLEAVLAHELCHVWRRDHLFGWVQLLVQVTFWFHPFVWLASRSMNRYCEVCCDDDAIRNFELDSRNYARGLLDVLENRQWLTSTWLAPGIRPAEVTKQRVLWIVDPIRSRGFRKSSFLAALLLGLVALPAFGTNDWSIGLIGQARTLSTDAQRDKDKERLGSANHDTRRREMDILIGKWQVKGPDGKVIGHSVFAFEDSGKMIREDWVANDKSTAQGMTYYDANLRVWKMTWVDEQGRIMELAGRWSGDALNMKGQATMTSGDTIKARTRLRKLSNDRIEMGMWVIDAATGTEKQVSKSLYLRQ